jgi:hypothetical protein
MIKHTKESIAALLATNDLAVMRGVVAIYDRQTRDEQAVGDTRHFNGIGFNGSDAKKGSYYARWLLSGRKLDGRHLANARKIMMKYSGQLARIANEKAQHRGE